VADRFAAAAQRSLGANESPRRHVIAASRRTARHKTGPQSKKTSSLEPAPDSWQPEITCDSDLRIEIHPFKDVGRL